MGSQQTRSAEELTTAIRSVVDRALESKVRDQVASRGKELAALITETAGTVAERASEAASDAWRETTPQRREAAKTADRLQRDALSWSRKTWAKQLRPMIQKAMKNRTATIGAAAGAVPISKELLDQARTRLGIQRREEHRWRTFFLGVVVGAIGGALVAILTAPRPGREMRDRIASRAREGAEEWAPLFQRPVETAKSIVAERTGNGSTPEAAEAAVDQVAGEAAETGSGEDQPAS